MSPEKLQLVPGIGKLPLEWQILEADAATLKISKGTTPPRSEIGSRGKIPFLRVNNLSFDGVLNDRSDFIFVSPESHNKFLSRSKAYPGDILMNIVGPPLGKTALLDEKYEEYNMNQAIVFYRLRSELLHAGYFIAFLNSANAQDWLQSRSKKTSGQQNLTIEICKQLPVPVPPLPEQKKIAQILSTWDKAITTTEKLLANSERQKKALMQQLLTGKKRLMDGNGDRFKGGRKFLKFDEVFVVLNRKSTQIKSSEYLERGAVPVVDQGQKLIAGYCNNKEVYSDIPVIVFGDHTRCLKWIDFEFCPGADGTQVINTKTIIHNKFGYYLLLNTDIPNLGYSRHMKELKEKEFKFPLEIEEQQKIAAVLSASDQEISVIQKNLEALKNEKKSLMQQLLTGKRRVKIGSNI